MSQNHQKLVAFQKAEALVPQIYGVTADFPHEGYALQTQMRRGCIATLANIVEGAIMSGLDTGLREAAGDERREA
jgi:hypothetical protein